MADDYVANPGSAGDTFAADDIGGVKYVRVKVVQGDNNTNNGDTSSTNPMPVNGGAYTHDAVDAGAPIKIGARAIAHGTNPTAVAAADRTDLFANRAGVLFTIGGHPNVKTAVYNSTAAQTDDNILPAIGAGTKYVITRLSVAVQDTTSVSVAYRIGFGAATLPALGASGADAVEGLLTSHPGCQAGFLHAQGDGAGIIGIGGDGEELRITNSVPTSGRIDVSVSYYTIES